jgi:predicted XRE-type DNA-binding protein
MERKQKTKSSKRNGGTPIRQANQAVREELMLQVAAVIRERGWTQTEAADFFGVGQPRISNLMQGKLDRFTVDLLMVWLQKLGKDVVVTIEDRNLSKSKRLGGVIRFAKEGTGDGQLNRQR